MCSPSQTQPAKSGINQYEKPSMMATSADDDARVWDGGSMQLYQRARSQQLTRSVSRRRE
jgi:hypothetical protein